VRAWNLQRIFDRHYRNERLDTPTLTLTEKFVYGACSYSQPVHLSRLLSSSVNSAGLLNEAGGSSHALAISNIFRSCRVGGLSLIRR
jgi:hypothetical protein